MFRRCAHPEGQVLHETPAIMLYLTERHALDNLAPPSGDALRGDFLSGFFFCSNDIQPEMKRFYFPTRYAPDESQAPAIHAQAKAMLLERYSVVDRRLADGRRFYLGERLSLVDLSLVFWATCVHPVAELFDHCPALQDYCARVTAAITCGHHMDAHREASERYWRDYLR